MFQGFLSSPSQPQSQLPPQPQPPSEHKSFFSQFIPQQSPPQNPLPSHSQIPLQNPQMTFLDKVNATADSFFQFLKTNNPLSSTSSQSASQAPSSLEPINIQSFETSKQQHIKQATCQPIKKNQLNDITVFSTIKNPRQIEKGFFELNYILYDIITEQFNWSVNRRYSDFIWLRNCLVAMFPGELIPQLPKKKIGNRRFEMDFVQKRQNSLQKFLNAILEKETFKSSEPLLIFLSCVDRALFEQQMKMLTPKILTPDCVENIKTFSGSINVLDFETEASCHSYLNNISMYTKKHEEILTTLHANLKSFHESMAMACSSLAEVEKNFRELTVLSTRSDVSKSLTNVYEQYEIFFKNWKRVLVNQTCVIKEIVNNYFKGVNRQLFSFNEMVYQQGVLKNEYNAKKVALMAKKEQLWMKRDYSKFELNPMEQVDSSKVYSDKEYAFGKMCYKETGDVEKMEKVLGYYYYKLTGEFANMVAFYEKEYNYTVKEFSEMIGKSITDSFNVWSHLESNIEKEEVVV